MNSLNRIIELTNQVMEQDELHQAFIDASPWGILVVDRSFTIHYMNKTLEDMSGYTLDEVVGESMHILLPEEDRKVHKEHEREYRKHPRVRHGDEPFRPRLLRKDGSTLDVEISLGPTKVRGVDYYFASIRDRNTLP